MTMASTGDTQDWYAMNYDDDWSADAFSDDDDKNQYDDDDDDDDLEIQEEESNEDDENNMSSSSPSSTCRYKTVLFGSTILLFGFSALMYQNYNELPINTLWLGGGGGGDESSDGFDNNNNNNGGMTVEFNNGETIDEEAFEQMEGIDVKNDDMYFDMNNKEDLQQDDEFQDDDDAMVVEYENDTELPNKVNGLVPSDEGEEEDYNDENINIFPPAPDGIDVIHGIAPDNTGNNNNDNDRPNMYTFFERVTKNTGMTDPGDDLLLQAWTDSWYAAGWNPIILRQADAQQHPDYEELMEKLEDFQFNDYNKMCFIRWIAMATIPGDDGGGGWMCDYDVFPLNPFGNEGYADTLPNDKRMTIHQGRIRRSAVPSLVSASSEEWTRMAHLLIENYVQHKQEDFWTDMFALQDLGLQTLYPQDEDVENMGYKYQFEMMNSVVDCGKVLQGEETNVNACEQTNHKRAIHFSHYGLQNSVLLPGESLDERADIALRWEKWWGENCEITEPYQVGMGMNDVDLNNMPEEETIDEEESQPFEDENNDMQQQVAAPNPDAPIIYTFFERINQKHEMTDEGDDHLLAAWTNAWSAAGWQPIILNYDDARNHHQYNEFNQMLQDFQFGEFDKLCFLRWVAMSAVGGGWMSDYDAFPLNSFVEEGFEDSLPNGGKLTVYGDTIKARHHSAVPSLVSGSDVEWTRMAHLLFDSYVQHKEDGGEENHWSDMKALQHLDIETFEVIPSVAVVSDVLRGEGTRDEACDVTKYMRAVHFSHFGLHHSGLQKGETVNDRPEIATKWLRWWKRTCKMTKVSLINAST